MERKMDIASEEKKCDNQEQTDAVNPKHDCLAIRYAEISDLKEVLEMYMAALSELKDGVLEPNIDKCADEVIFSWSQAPCVLITKNQDIIGFAGLKTVIPAYTDKNIISEYMFYIKPKHRSMKAARMLADECKKIADRFGLPLFFTHFLNGVSVDKKENFLRRWGFKPFGVFCTYGVNNG